MAILVNHFNRRDNASVEAFGNAAYDYCRASRAQAGTRSSRFYWVDIDTIVVQSEAESFEVFDRPGTPEMGKAAFALLDLARSGTTERWLEPQAAQEAYRSAGR